MPIVANQAQSPATIHTDLGAIFVSLELSSINLVDHVALARWRGEDVEAFGVRW